MSKIIKIGVIMVICLILAVLIKNIIHARHESAVNHAIDSLRQTNHWDTNQTPN